MSLKNTGDYDLKECIFTGHNGTSMDISQLAAEISLYEDIYQNTMSGSIAVIDTIAMVSSFPIIGGEKIDIKLSVPTLEVDLEYSFLINSIGGREIIKENTESFFLHLISPETITNTKIRISKSYDDLYSNVITELFGELSSEKGIEVEESVNSHLFIVPNMTPMKAINWLATKSIGSEYMVPSYLFFERSDGFWCKTLDMMLDGESKWQYSVGNRQHRDFKGPLDSPGKDINYEFNTVESYRIQTAFDISSNMINGMYGSSLISHDIHRKIYTKYDYLYDDDFALTNTIGMHQLCGTVGNCGDLYDNGGGKNLSSQYLIPTHKEHDIIYALYPSDNDDYKSEEYIMQRRGRLQEFNNFKMIIQVDGNVHTHAGDCLDFEIPVLDPSKGSESDSYYSGKYLISAVRHTITADKMTTTLELIKDSLESELGPSVTFGS